MPTELNGIDRIIQPSTHHYLICYVSQPLITTPTNRVGMQDVLSLSPTWTKKKPKTKTKQEEEEDMRYDEHFI